MEIYVVFMRHDVPYVRLFIKVCVVKKKIDLQKYMQFCDEGAGQGQKECIKYTQKGETMGIKVVPEVYDQLPENPVEMLLVTFDSQDDIAAFCSVSPQAVWNWKWREAIPHGHIPALSAYTGIPEWMLCPKHFERSNDKGERDVAVQSVGESGGEAGAN